MKRAREPDEPPPLPPSPSPPASPASINADGRPTPSVPDASYYAGGHGGEPEQPRTKIASLSLDSENSDHEADAAMSCLLHRERMDFPSIDAYEAHYNKEHLNRCIECRRNFPSPLYLGLHSDEWHDPFIAVRREKGEHTYACFVEGCDRKCASPDKRRRHLIDKHNYPKNFFFSITQFGVDGRQSLLDNDGRQRHRRRSSASNVAKKDMRRRAASIPVAGSPASPEAPGAVTPESQETAAHTEAEGRGMAAGKASTDAPMREASVDETPDAEMDDLVGAISAMSFIPRSVRFGRGGKAGFVRR